MNVNIGVEYPMRQITAVRCFAPTEIHEIRQLLLTFTSDSNPLMLFNLVEHGDIAVLAPSIEKIVRASVPDYPLVYKVGRRKFRKEYSNEVYDDRAAFSMNNRTNATLLFLYDMVMKQWLFFDKTVPTSGWQPLVGGVSADTPA